jgi:hypothetical protein
MTTDPEALQTIAYLANELRKAHETAAGLYQAVQQQKAELDKLKAPAAVAAPTEGDAP